MTDTHPYGKWLRALSGFLAAAAVLTLTACGGGSGAPNNPYAPQPAGLSVVPAAVVAYSGMATTLTVSGGATPYRAYSANTGILPVTQAVSGSTVVLQPANVSSDTDVEITIQDSAGKSTAAVVTVRAAPLLNSLTITPNLTECGTTAICSGQNGTAVVTVLGPQGGAVAGRQVRFDVVAGPYGITTPNSGQPNVSTLTVLSGSDGNASVLIRANVNAPTQFSQLRVTDLTSGQQLVGNFLIQQVTDGSKMLTVVPGAGATKITAFYKGECSAGFRTDYYIYGGTPPYRVTPTFPTAVTPINPIVSTDGGFFEAVTNGTCVDPMTFSILDAVGRQTTTTLANVEGSADRTTVAAPDLVASPATYTETGCTNKTFSFVVSGGTVPYNVSASRGNVDTPIVSTAGGTARVSGLLTGSGVSTVVFLDSSLPQKSFTATITCTDPTTAPTAALAAAPTSYTSTACTGNTFPIAITGGSPPYRITSTRGVATPTVVTGSGGTTSISGLVSGTGVTAVVILDQSVPEKSVGVNITCAPAAAETPPPALNVTGDFTYTGVACSLQTSNFAISGGTPPYSVSFAAPVPASGTITPTTVQASGQGFSVTALPDLPAGSAGSITYVTVTDSGAIGVSRQQAIRSIVCKP